MEGEKERKEWWCSWDVTDIKVAIRLCLYGVAFQFH